jgi:hypothetical protein
MAAAVSLVNQGRSEEEILRLKDSFPKAITRKPDYWIRTVERAFEFVKTNPSSIEGLVLKALATLRSPDLKVPEGTSRAAIQIVVAAHVCIVLRCGHITHGASERELSEISGMGRSGIRDTHKWAVELGILRRLPSRRPRATASWVLTLPNRLRHLCKNDPIHTSLTPEPVRHEWALFCTPGHDAFRRGGGLGKAGWQIWHTLVFEGSLSVAQIAERTGRSRRTVYHALKKLAGVGLSAQERSNWSARIRDLDTVANETGTAGIQDRQRSRHKLARLRNRERGKLITKRPGDESSETERLAEKRMRHTFERLCRERSKTNCQRHTKSMTNF